MTGACGSRVYAPFRGCEMEVRHLKPMFDAGQVRLRRSRRFLNVDENNFTSLEADIDNLCLPYV